jgi:hypothetical protein
MYYPCSCADFKDDEGKWVSPAPEDVQRCSLVEWVRGRLWEVMVEDEEAEITNKLAEGAREDEEWEMMSNATSEGWSVVSQESEADVVLA